MAKKPGKTSLYFSSETRNDLAFLLKHSQETSVSGILRQLARRERILAEQRQGLAAGLKPGESIRTYIVFEKLSPDSSSGPAELVRERLSWDL